MFGRTIGLIGLLVGIGGGLGGCTDGYGYSGVNVGYASGGYYDGYGPGYGYAGYAPSYFGWYGDYYYPGTGVYVYDRYRRRQVWNDGQRRYWEGRRGGGYQAGQIRDNWADFRRDARRERRDYRGDIRDNRQAFRDGTINRDQFHDGRQQARREYRNDVRREWRQTRQENRAIRQGAPGGGRAFRGGGGPGPRGGGRPR
jgi:hypothetical protein